jgi:hypothetical protein
MRTLFNAFDWQHFVLLGGAIISGLLVGIGIFKEYKEWSVAAVMVLVGIVIEPIFTIALFVYDESLSREQNLIIVSQDIEGLPERGDRKNNVAIRPFRR